MNNHNNHKDCENIYLKWHEYAKSRQVDPLLSLYVDDAKLESPLVPAILDIPSGVLNGHAQLRQFFEEGVKCRPNELVRWYRTEKYYCDGTTLIWEYPWQIPDGEQIDILEVIELRNSKIAYHRIYWGWFGIGQLITSAIKKAEFQFDSRL